MVWRGVGLLVFVGLGVGCFGLDWPGLDGLDGLGHSWTGWMNWVGLDGLDGAGKDWVGWLGWAGVGLDGPRLDLTGRMGLARLWIDLD